MPETGREATTGRSSTTQNGEATDPQRTDTPPLTQEGSVSNGAQSPARPESPAAPSESPPPRPRAGWRQMFSSLRHPQYRIMMSGMMPALFGMQMGMVSFSYLAYTLSGSATVLGAMGLAWGFPMLFLSLFGGVAADRFPRRKVLMLTQGTIGLTAVINAILVITGSIQVWHLFVIGLIQGSAFAFNMPARTALIGEAVGKDDMANAIALNNAAMNMSRVAGPGLAGFLIAWPLVGPGGVFIIMAAGYAYVVWTISRLTVGRIVESTGPTRRTGREQLIDGLLYIRRSPSLVTLLSLAVVPILLGMPYQILLPVFALGVLNVGAEGMGLMQMASGVGALVGSLGVAALGTYEHKATLQLAFGVLFGLSLVLFAISNSFILALLILPIVGAMASAYMAINNALVMANTSRELYGRVMSVYMMTFALMPLGGLPAASLADAIGPQLTVALAGGLLAAVVAAIAVLVPSYRQIR
jgi:MFS transporter, DHA1 family, staphyloferrin A biosynthesis exporter